MAKKHRPQARKQPSQRRSRVTVEAIVEAAARILAIEGTVGLTTNRVAVVAGVSVGTLYQYFPNKQAIVVALIERQLEEDQRACHQTLAAQAGRATPEALATMAEQMLDYQMARAPLLTVLLELLPELESLELKHRSFAAIASVLETFIDERQADLRPELADRGRRAEAAFVCVHALLGAADAAMVHEPGRAQKPEFRAEFSQLLTTLLRR